MHTNSHVSISLPRPRSPASIVPRTVPLSVHCRSSCLVILSGRHNLMYRPTRNRRDNALTGTLICRYNVSRLNAIRNRSHPNVIRHLSHSASNLVLTTGSSSARHTLRGLVHAHALSHHCVALIRNRVTVSRNAVGANVTHSAHSHIGVTISSSPFTHRTVAAFGILRHFSSAHFSSNCALIRYRLFANHARRVHIRVHRVGRTYINSPLCNGYSTHTSRKLAERFLRS